MPAQYDTIGESGLQFFGKVSASISHELKNVLAIINENAGLLEDLTLAAQRGKAIDPERLNRTAGNFLKQIHRAHNIDGIGFNRILIGFTHQRLGCHVNYDFRSGRLQCPCQ